MKKQLFISVLCIVTFLCLIYGCIPKNDNLLLIGATLDFTGPNAVYGNQVKDGVDLAISFINDSLNHGTEKVKVLYQDSKSNDAAAIGNVQRFINFNGIRFFIGEVASNATLALIPTIENNQAFLFAPASSSQVLTNASPNFARNWPSNDFEAKAAGIFAVEEFKSVSPVIVYVNSYYGIGLKERFIKTLEEYEIIVTDELSFAVDQTDFRTIILKLRNINYDCLYLAGNPKEMGRFMKQLAEQKRIDNINIISNTGFLQPDCLDVAGSTANGVIVPTPKQPNEFSHIQSVARFNHMFYNKYKKEPTLVNSNGFDAIMLIYQAVGKFGNDPLLVAEYIRNLKGFEGASGKYSFKDGDIEADVSFYKIKNQKPILLINN